MCNSPTSAARRMYMLNDWPPVITSPGDYVTRDGRRVTIATVSPPSFYGHATTRFTAKGHVWGMFRGKSRPVTSAIWHISGRRVVLHEHATDIVGRWPTSDAVGACDKLGDR